MERGNQQESIHIKTALSAIRSHSALRLRHSRHFHRQSGRGPKLSWFFPVLTSLLFCASQPSSLSAPHVPEEYRRRALILQFTLPLAFLFLILLSTGIYNPLEWLLNSYLGILFAYSLFVLPVFFKKLDVFEKKTRLLLAFTTPLAMLLLLMLYECVISGGDWFIISALGVLVVYKSSSYLTSWISSTLHEEI